MREDEFIVPKIDARPVPRKFPQQIPLLTFPSTRRAVGRGTRGAGGETRRESDVGAQPRRCAEGGTERRLS